MAESIADTRVFQYFTGVNSTDTSAGDYQHASQESIRQANQNIWDMFMSAGASLPALLLTISTSTSNQLVLKQNWMSRIVDFIKINQPNVTSVKGMFESQNEEVVGWKDGKLDSTITDILQLAAIFSMHAGSDINGNLTIDRMFDATSLANFRAAYTSALPAIYKLNSGGKLSFDEKKQLASMFEKLNTCMSSLNLSFAPPSDQSSGLFDISSDSLQSKLSALTNLVSSTRQKFDPLITNIYNPAAIMHN